MKTKNSYIVIAVFMMVVLGAGIVFAKGSCLCAVTNLPGLELKSDQKAKLEKQQTEHCKKMIRLRADLSIAKLEKQKIIADRNFNEDAVRKQIEKIIAVKRDMQMARLNALTEIRDVLTDEQWLEFSSNITSKCGRPCANNGPVYNRQMRGKHHRGSHKGKDFDCGMRFSQNREDCPFSGNRMRMEN